MVSAVCVFFGYSDYCVGFGCVVDVVGVAYGVGTAVCAVHQNDVVRLLTDTSRHGR